MLQQEFEQLTGIKVSAEDFKTINEMYMNAGNIDQPTFCKAYKKGDFLSIVPTIMESIKEETRKENLQELIKYGDKIQDLEKQIAEKDAVIREKDEQLQQHLEVLKKTIKDYMNLGSYEQISAFKMLFNFAGYSEADWVEFLCDVARSND